MTDVPSWMHESDIAVVVRNKWCCMPCRCCMSGVAISHSSQVAVHSCRNLIETMGKRGHATHDMPLAAMSTRRVTKSAIADVLEVLHEKGMLDVRVTRQCITRDVKTHASVVTPYGPVVQKLDVGIDINVECCPPAALLYYL